MLPAREIHVLNPRNGITPDFSIRENGLQIELFGHTMYIYRELRNGTFYKGEYLIVDFQGMGETPFKPDTSFPDETTHFKQSFLVRFDTLTQESDGSAIYHLKGVVQPYHGRVDMIVDLRTAQVGFGTLKFSVNLTEWQFNSTSNFVSYFISITTKSAHSPRVPMTCNTVSDLSEFKFNTTCTNPDGPYIIGSSTVEAVSLLGVTQTSRLAFTYPLFGLSDGRNSFVTHVAYFARMYGGSPVPPSDIPASAEQQSSIIPFVDTRFSIAFLSSLWLTLLGVWQAGNDVNIVYKQLLLRSNVFNHASLRYGASPGQSFGARSRSRDHRSCIGRGCRCRAHLQTFSDAINAI